MYPILHFPDVPTVYWTLFFSREKADKVLSHLDPASTTDPDGIRGNVLKSCSAVLAPPESLFSHPCPLDTSHWKSANFTPIHKGVKTDPINDRPMSLLPIRIKVMESIIASDVKSFLFSNNLVSHNQFGFHPNQ